LIPWLSLWELALITVLLEMTTIVTILFCPVRWALIAVCSLYSAIAVYRVFLHISHLNYTCLCFGYLHKIVGISDANVQRISLDILWGLLLGGYSLTILNGIPVRSRRLRLEEEKLPISPQ